MGTNIEGVLVEAPVDQAAIISAALESAVAQQAKCAVLHLFRGKIGSKAFLWAELSDDRKRSIRADRALAQRLSKLGCRSLWLAYSDASGQDEGILFEDGEPMSISQGMVKAVAPFFPKTSIRDADDLFEIVYGEASTNEAFALVRDGWVLESPEPWVPPSEAPYRPPLLAREFESLRGVRRVFKWGVYLFGAVGVLLVLGVVVAFVIEMLR